jgi:hypothetical protein
MANKLKKNDVVLFNWDGKPYLGIVESTYKKYLNIQYDWYYGVVAICNKSTIYKIGEL